jgi:hypothetical protein
MTTLQTSDEIHIVKIWKYNYHALENKLYPRLKGTAKKVYNVRPTPYHFTFKDSRNLAILLVINQEFLVHFQVSCNVSFPWYVIQPRRLSQY